MNILKYIQYTLVYEYEVNYFLSRINSLNLTSDLRDKNFTGLSSTIHFKIQ